MLVRRQGGQNVQRVILAHDHQHQAIGVTGRKPVDHLGAGDGLLPGHYIS